VWSQLRAEANTLLTSDGNDENRFTDAQIRLLSERIDAVEAHILKVAAPSATPEQRAHVHGAMEDTKAAAEKMTRKEWRIYLLGQVSSVLMTLALEPNKARDIMHTIVVTLAPWLAKMQNLIG
jgi:hypothetical protein